MTKKKISGSVSEHGSKKHRLGFVEMTVRSVFYLLSLVFFFCLTVGDVARAADLPFPVAVIDVREVLAKSAAGQSLQSQLKERRESFQKDFVQIEKDLQSRGKAILAERATLSQDAFEEKKKVFEKELQEARKRFQTLKRALDEGFASSIGQIRSRIVSIATDLSRERGYRLVMTRENLVVVDKSLDITGDVMSRMNKDMPNVVLKVSSE